MPYQTNPYQTLNPWWSPIPGTDYYHVTGPRTKYGFGGLARDKPGVFNLYWAMCQLPTPDKVLSYKINAQLWQLCVSLAAQTVAGSDLGDTTLVLQLSPFIEWFTKQRLDKWTSDMSPEEFLQELQKAVDSLRSCATLLPVHPPHSSPT